MADTKPRAVHKLYGGEIQIEVVEYPTYHLYRKLGTKQFLISPSSAAGIVDKSRVLIGWAVRTDFDFLRERLGSLQRDSVSRDELYPMLVEAAGAHEIKKTKAADSGTEIHDFCERFAKSKMGLGDVPDMKQYENNEPVLNGIQGFLDWFNANKVEFVEIERVVYSKKYDFAGRFDLIAKVDGKLMLLDYKTGKGVYDESGLQLAAYRLAWEEENGKQLDGHGILHLDKETAGFEYLPYTPEEYARDLVGFLAALQLKKWQKAVEKANKA